MTFYPQIHCSGAYLLSPKRLSSALAGLIALFGMGRDVTPPSKHQNIIFKVIRIFNLLRYIIANCFCAPTVVGAPTQGRGGFQIS